MWIPSSFYFFFIKFVFILWKMYRILSLRIKIINFYFNRFRRAQKVHIWRDVCYTFTYLSDRKTTRDVFSNIFFAPIEYIISIISLFIFFHLFYKFLYRFSDIFWINSSAWLSKLNPRFLPFLLHLNFN